MCGIAGIWRKAGVLKVSDIVRMSEVIAHRGPDDLGYVMIDTRGRLPMIHFIERFDTAQEYNLALANRRLSIIDLSPSGHQPMTWDGCTIVYNGEIYNYIELREALHEKGHLFSSQSDTEVLLHAYLEWGVDCLSHLNGMFAFAIWDSRKQELFCARDRLGIKPFYYYLTSAQLIFASEIKSILAVVQPKPDVNEGLVYDFLSMGWLDHTDETFFENILRLPAGSYMMVSRERTQIIKYWDLDNQKQVSASLAENAERFRELFTDAVRLQMRSDVTVGCCLSGGMDSTAVVSLAAPQSPYRMQTFTARFHGDSMDEWPYVQAVASRAPIDTVSIFVEPKDFWDALPDVVWSQEEPFISPSVYAQWLLMRTIRASNVTVVLDGQGGDELFCGYAKFFYFYLRDLLCHRRLGQLAATLIVAIFNGGSHLLDLSAAQRYLPRKLNPSYGKWLYPDFEHRYADRYVDRPRGDLNIQQILDIKQFSLPVLLRYEDKNSMAYSIESRVPFLDHRFVEFALALPAEHKLYGGEAKRVMRHALSDIMPPKILRRRRKIGFGGSFSSWIGDLEISFEKWIDSHSEALDHYIQPFSLKGLLYRRDPSLFRILILDKWLERFGYS